MADGGLRSPTRHLVEPGAAPAFDPPSLVVSQVEVQHIELVHGHQVDVAQHLVDREEMSGHVDHEASPLVRRLVVDDDCRHRPGPTRHRRRSPSVIGQELAKRGCRGQKAGAVANPDIHTPCGIDGQAIAADGNVGTAYS